MELVESTNGANGSESIVGVIRNITYDPIFKHYVQTFKDKWDDGEDIDWSVLAEKAVKKYKALCEAGIWKTSDVQKQQIVALTSAIQTMTKAMSSMPNPKKPPEPPEKLGSGNPPKGPKTLITERGAPKYTAWKMTPPIPGELKEMQKGPCTYHWCTNHGTVGM